MKTLLRIHYYVYLITLTLGIFSCSPDDTEPIEEQEQQEVINDLVEQENAVSADDFEAFAGEVGAIINTRDIARKGYTPTEAILTIEGDEGTYSQTVPINNTSFLGRVTISREGLSETALAELENGIDIQVELKGSDGETIITENLSATPFTSNPSPRAINASVVEPTPAFNTLNFNSQAEYYVQRVDVNGVPTTMSMKISQSTGIIKFLTRSTNTDFSGIVEQPDHIFSFFPIPGEENTFAIRNTATMQFVAAAFIPNTITFFSYHAPYMTDITSIESVLNLPDTQIDNFKFVIEKEADGVYRFKSKIYDNYLDVLPGVGLVISGYYNDSEPAYWRIIDNSLDWDVASISTTFIAPTLPPPSTSFGANSILTNCTEGTLEQTIGGNEGVSRTTTVGWEESFSLTGSVTNTVTAEVGVEFEAGFFGTSASYDASLTTSLETSVNMTSASASYEDYSETVTSDLFLSRLVTVPPQSATLVYDVAQIYSNTSVHLVQVFRLRAMNGNTSLTGEEILSQLQFSRYTGVPVQIGSDFIDISVKGTQVLGKVLETRSTAQSIDPGCN